VQLDQQRQVGAAVRGPGVGDRAQRPALTGQQPGDVVELVRDIAQGGIGHPGRVTAVVDADPRRTPRPWSIVATPR
jgi:hypothetical protein